MNQHDYEAAQRSRLTGSLWNAAPSLDDPIRKHEPDGIGEPPAREQTEETYNLALEFLRDVTSPEGYGFAVPVEMVKRATRILSTLRPRGYVAPREDQE
jgi:hypothetical protein